MKSEPSYETYVISLAREPDKFPAFLARNQATGLAFRRFVAVDGSLLSEDDSVRLDLVKPGARLYTKGHIGCAASHRDLWLYAAATGKSILVFEDDAFCRHDLVPHLAAVLDRLPDWQIVLLGYNTDATIDLQNGPPTLPAIVANPRPSFEQLTAFAATTEPPHAFRLNIAFGQSAYLVSPQGAQTLLSLFPMDNRPLWLADARSGGKLRPFRCMTIDMLANTLYRGMQAYALVPPLALPLNDHATSTTRRPRS